MDFFKQNKIALIGVLIVIVGVAVYFMFFTGKGSSATLSASDDTSPVSTDLLVALQNLNGIKLDESVFKNPVFLSLTDFGVTIPPQEVGRRNPFLPLPGGSSGTKSGIQLPGAGN